MWPESHTHRHLSAPSTGSHAPSHHVCPCT
jgi:hypothetical protein